MNILKSRKIKIASTLLAASVAAAYGTGYGDDAYYIIGGVKRGVKCAFVGVQIGLTYKMQGINEETHEYAAKKLYKVFRENSGCYIKLGQIVCQLEHIIPEAYVRELEPLINEGPVSNFESIKKLIEREYKKPLEMVFAEFDPVPVGSASLAQVHKAKLHDGTEVAVKVQHAHIPFHCPGDIMTVRMGCYFAEKLFPEFKYRWLGGEFKTNLPKEIDFRNEGKNTERVSKQFRHYSQVVIPRIYWDFTTTKILVMSYEQGRPITNMKYIKENHISIDEVASILSELFNRQIFHYGFVHSDPHPGNLFVRKDLVNGKQQTRVVLLDHGLYRELDTSFRYNYASLWRGIITQNKDIIRQSSKNLGISKVELFLSILTSNTYDDIMDDKNKFQTKTRFNAKKTDKQKERLKKYASIYHKEITHVLSDVRSEMLLLLKVNEFLRNIDRKIGNPLNNVEHMMSYIYEEVAQHDRDKMGFLSRVSLNLEYFKFKFMFTLLGCWLSLKHYVNPPLEEKTLILEDEQQAINEHIVNLL